jgi:hypothetical protein
VKNYHQKIKKQNRPLTAAEQIGMSSLLSGLKKIREKATEKPCVTSALPRRDIFTTKPIP